MKCQCSLWCWWAWLWCAPVGGGFRWLWCAQVGGGFRKTLEQGQAPPMRLRKLLHKGKFPQGGQWQPAPDTHPRLRGVSQFERHTHHLLHSKQSCVLGRAGLSVISVIQVRTVRLRGKNPRPQHQREVGSEPLPWSRCSHPYLRGSMNTSCPCLWGHPHPEGSQRRAFPYSKWLSFLVTKSPVLQKGRKRNVKVQSQHEPLCS